MTSTWKTTTDRFVGFFDIMGFKDIVQRKSHDEILSLMNKLNEEIIQPIESVSYIKKNNKGKARKLPTPIIRPVIFSDSILLISTSNTELDLILITCFTTYVIDHCLEIGLPIKGAISFGKFTADFEKSIYFGQPLIDAYLLQDELLMYGAVFDHTAESFIHKNQLIDDLANVIQIYKVPLKSGKVTHYLADWLSSYDEPKDMLSKTNKLYHSVSGKSRIYVDNTIDYVNYLISLYEK